MKHQLTVFNTISRKKEKFEPISTPHVGMYVCGPTVYGDPHLGHARPAITFDIVFRLLKHLGYKVRYVRNITDVGHLEHDSDDGEDKIQKKARLEQLEPMEIAQYYTNRYVEFMNQLNVLSPSIEPRASGHIIEQIEFVQAIIDAGFAYQVNGSVYFDVKKYNEQHHYGKLSGRKLDELLENTRQLDGQDEKRFSADFALWKKASDEHIMKWNSPWSKGFPGWHLECSAMGLKYLGEQFDIHGGGMDLLFPHHESEIAQCVAGRGHEPAKYWLHNNMITINGQKMGKSLGNFITLEEFFTGNHQLLEQIYEPMTIRFFILQAHYRSTLDFSNHALLSAQKAYRRLVDAKQKLETIHSDINKNCSENHIEKLVNAAYAALCDDFNTPIAIAQLFEAAKIINLSSEGKQELCECELKSLHELFHTVFIQILGLTAEKESVNQQDTITDDIMSLLLNIRTQVKNEKNYEMADFIRNELDKIGVRVKDTKEGFTWELKK
jgi:cysteinyl-tRNA synthetase